MSILAKNNKKSQFKTIKNQTKLILILKFLIELNQYKTSPNIKYITVSKVKFLIAKMIKRYKRLLKVYWAIDIKNKNYKQSGGLEEYSAKDIYNMVIQILKKDGYGKVCKRTIERDIKLLNEMGLIKSQIIRFGECRGSKSHYKQNMELAPLNKEIIFEYLKVLLIESLSDKKIVGDFDDALDDEKFDYTNLEKFGILSKVNVTSTMSHVCEPDDLYKNNISYINNKNSIENSKEMLSKKIVTSTQKIRKCKLERQDVESRLISIQKVDKGYLKKIKESCNNDATYVNSLINLETAIIDYKNEYEVEHILEHFLKQFANQYKNKIWMMMKRKDGVISDYELIWEGRFRDLYPNKYKSELSPTTNQICYGKHIRIKDRKYPSFTNKSAEKKDTSSYFTVSHLQQNEEDRLKREEREREDREQEKRRIELKQREKYLKELFEREAQEMQKRLRKAREEKERQRKQIRQSMLSNSSNPPKNSVATTIDDTVSPSNVLANNGALNMNSSNHSLDNQSVFEDFCKQKGGPPAASSVATFSGMTLNVSYGGFKTTKGMKISLASLGINVPLEQEKGTIEDKEKEYEI